MAHAGLDQTHARAVHKHIQNFKKHFDSNLEAELERRRRNVAAKKIQERWEAYWVPFRTEKKKRIQVTLMKFSFRLLSRLANIDVVRAATSRSASEAATKDLHSSASVPAKGMVPPGPGMEWDAIVRRSVPSGNTCVSVLVEIFEQALNACSAF